MTLPCTLRWLSTARALDCNKKKLQSRKVGSCVAVLLMVHQGTSFSNAAVHNTRTAPLHQAPVVYVEIAS